MANNTIQDNAANYSSYGTSFGKAPASGPKSLTCIANFTAAISTIQFDLSLAHSQDKMEFIQAAYVDNSLNPNPFSIAVPVTQQVLTWPPFSQGYLPVEATDASVFVASTTGGYIGKVNVLFLNHPVPAELWSANGQTQISGYDYNGVAVPGLIASGIVAGKLNAAGITNCGNGPPGNSGYYVTGITLALSGDATLAVAGELEITVYDYVFNGTSTNFADLIVYLPAAVPAAPVPNYTILNLTGMQFISPSLYGGNEKLRINLSAALVTGQLSYTFVYGANRAAY